MDGGPAVWWQQCSCYGRVAARRIVVHILGIVYVLGTFAGTLRALGGLRACSCCIWPTACTADSSSATPPPPCG
eukprot:9580564-Alexandrium_andersonii.AAC.1